MSATTHPRSAHPRFRDRRQNVTAEVERQRWARYFTLLSPVLVAVALLGAMRSPLAEVDRVEITGAGLVPTAAIEQSARVAPGAQLIDVDLAGIEQRVRALPGVATASARRDWPNGIVITVTERLPVAAVAGPGSSWLTVDLTGTVIKATTSPNPALPVIRFDGDPALAAPGAEMERASAAVAAADAMPFDLVDWITEIAVDDGGIARFRLVGDADAVFGDQQGLADKYVSLATVLSRVDRTCLDRIDVRVPEAPVVTRRPNCE